MKIYPIEEIQQNTEEWMQLRCGKITGTKIQKFLTGGNDVVNKELFKLAAERLTNTRCDSDSWSNVHSERGHLYEPVARLLYEVTQDATVKEVGFVEKDDLIGCSPDGLIEDDGLIEIKCKDNHTYLEYAMRKKIEKHYRLQMQFNMYVTDRKWCDYLVFNNNFHNNLIVQRVLRDDEVILSMVNKILEIRPRLKTIMDTFSTGENKFDEIERNKHGINTNI